MEKFKNLERVVCKELEKLDGVYEGKNEFTKEDAEKFKKQFEVAGAKVEVK